MPSLGELHAQDRKIEDLFTTSNFYRIPEYQRPYSRGKDQANDFRNDLKDSDDGMPYFFGSFVFNKKSEAKEQEKTDLKRIDVIDGQQRLLTITIFIAVLRDIAVEIGVSGLAEEVQNDYIHKTSHRKGFENPYKILPGETTKDYFLKIQNREDLKKSKPQTKEEKTLKSVYDTFHEKITSEINLLSDYDDKSDYLWHLLDLIKAASCIEILVDDDDIAYTIFETVNARGADLSVGDLVKNLFIKFFDKDKNKEEGIKLWKELENNINDCDGDISTFLRHYRLSKYKYISKKNLFKAIREEINTKNYKQRLEEITECSSYYKIILNSSGGYTDLINEMNRYGDDINDTKDIRDIYSTLSGINTFKITQFAPIFMAIFKHYRVLTKCCNPSEIAQNLENFGYAFFGICSSPARAIEQECSRFASKLRKDCIDSSLDSQQRSTSILKNIAEHKSFLNENYPNYDTFKGNFSKLGYKKSALTKYTLWKVSNYLEKTSHGGNTLGFDAVQLEHILPQKPSNRGLKVEEVKDYVDLIGNITLIPKDMNIKGGNKPLQEKTESEGGLKDCNVAMTQALVIKFRETNYVWGELEIRSRTNELCELIYRIQQLR